MAGKLVDAPAMYAIAKRIMEELIDESVDSDGLLAETPCGSHKLDRRPEYELRYVSLQFSEDGIIGRQTERQFEGIVRYSLAMRLQQLNGEQPNCTWKPVAASIGQLNLRKTWVIESAPQADGSDLAGTLYQQAVALIGRNASGPQSIGSTKRTEERPDYRLVVEIAFADLARADLRDPTGEHPDGRPGAFEKYAMERNLRWLPHGFKKQRKLAAAVIREFYSDRDLPPVNPEALPKRPPVVRSEVTNEVTDEEAQKAELLRHEGKTWGEVGEVLGKPWQSVKAAVLKRKTGGAPAVGTDAGV